MKWIQQLHIVFYHMNNSKGNIPRMRPESRHIRLADGTSSCKRLSSVSIRCKADNSDSKVLDFYVMNAPGNLLGRYAIEELWPKLFTEFVKVANNATATEDRNIAGTPEVVSKTEVQGESMAPTLKERTIVNCQNVTKKIQKEKVEPKVSTTSQYKKKTAKVSREKLNSDPVNMVRKCSSNVSVCADLRQVVVDGSSSSHDGVPGTRRR